MQLATQHLFECASPFAGALIAAGEKNREKAEAIVLELQRVRDETECSGKEPPVLKERFFSKMQGYEEIRKKA